MHQVMVRYKVKPDRVAENEALVRAVYEELSRTDPGGFRYSTYRLEDGVTFVHLAQSEEGPAPLGRLGAFKRFTEHINDRVDEAPVVSQIETIGTYDGARR
jgi:hypothetical protein